MFGITIRSLVLGSLAVLIGTLSVVESADAQVRRVRWDPDYGAPFANLGWRGEADVQYGSCTGPGWVDNSAGSCNGALSFLNATVELYDIGTPDTTLQTLNFTGGLVDQLNFDGSGELTDVLSTPFTPIQGIPAQTEYMGTPAYFSLIFVGKYAQLYWFKDYPNSAAAYIGCYNPGDNGFGSNRCGISSNLDGAGAELKITPVPEPGTYALMLAGLGMVMFIARRRQRG
jgi:hypothetical protein